MITDQEIQKIKKNLSRAELKLLELFLTEYHAKSDQVEEILQANERLSKKVEIEANAAHKARRQVEEMQKDLDKSREQATTFLNSKIDVSNERHHLKHENTKLRQVNAEMQKTLEWYADEGVYAPWVSINGDISDVSDAEKDNGERARQALKGVENNGI